MISIVVPVYNAERFIVEAIESVLAQTYGDWELILSDDGSTDGSIATIEELLKQIPAGKKERIHLIRGEKNTGPAGARNRGLAIAKGRYLAFLDADDIWQSDKLKKQMKLMDEADAGFVFTAYEFGDESGKGTGRIVSVPATINYRQALSRTIISTPTTLFDLTRIDRKLLEMPEVYSEDTATWWQILRQGHVAHGLNEVTTIYRRHPGTLSANKREAIRRIWFLYRRMERLSLLRSVGCFVPWAFRATWRRV